MNWLVYVAGMIVVMLLLASVDGEVKQSSRVPVAETVQPYRVSHGCQAARVDYMLANRPDDIRIAAGRVSGAC